MKLEWLKSFLLLHGDNKMKWAFSIKYIYQIKKIEFQWNFSCNLSRCGQGKWVLSPQMATFRCSQWSFLNIYITNILLLSTHVAMWRPLANSYLALFVPAFSLSRPFIRTPLNKMYGFFLGILRVFLIPDPRPQTRHVSLMIFFFSPPIIACLRS